MPKPLKCMKNTHSKGLLFVLFFFFFFFTLLSAPLLKSLWSFVASSVFCLDISSEMGLKCVISCFPYSLFPFLFAHCLHTNPHKQKACACIMQYGTRPSVQWPSCCSVRLVCLTTLIVPLSWQQRFSTLRTLILTR